MALVPDNFTFSLQDVYAVTGYANLSDSFTYSVPSYRDLNYWGVEQGMKQFRNYGPKDYFSIDYTTLYFNSTQVACNSAVVHVTTNLTWDTIIDTSEMTYASISPTSGTGDATVTWNCGSNNLKGSDRYGSISFINHTGGAELAYVSIVQYYGACR
jgi:hypothetical protein